MARCKGMDCEPRSLRDKIDKQNITLRTNYLQIFCETKDLGGSLQRYSHSQSIERWISFTQEEHLQTRIEGERVRTKKQNLPNKKTQGNTATSKKFLSYSGRKTCCQTEKKNVEQRRRQVRSEHQLHFRCFAPL
jgi:hypothetical protein